MDELLTPTPGEIWLLHTPPKATMLALVARMAVRGPLLTLDAANEFDAHKVARLIRRQTRQLDEVLGRVRVARAFTCYQVLTLFEQLPATPIPHVVFDLPATFYDENVPFGESRRLLQLVLHHIERLRQDAPIVISVRPTRSGRRAELMQSVIDRADHLFVWETPASPTPRRLF